MTVQEVFNLTMDLISERLDSGVVDATSTANYKARTLGLVTMIQSEICRQSPLYKSLDIEPSGTSGYVKLELPSGYVSIYQILDEDLNATDKYKIVGTDIYVPFDFNGKLVYRYVPTAITSMTDSIAFDNIIATNVITNGLAGQLLLTENASLSDYFNQRYEEKKREIKTKQPAPITKRKDYNDASLKF